MIMRSLTAGLMNTTNFSESLESAVAFPTRKWRWQRNFQTSCDASRPPAIQTPTIRTCWKVTSIMMGCRAYAGTCDFRKIKYALLLRSFLITHQFCDIFET